MYTNTVRHLHTYIYTKQCYIPSQGNIYSCDFSHKELANWHFNHETLPVIPNLSEWTIKTKTRLPIQYTLQNSSFIPYSLVSSGRSDRRLVCTPFPAPLRHRLSWSASSFVSAWVPTKRYIITSYVFGHLLYHFNRYKMYFKIMFEFFLCIVSIEHILYIFNRCNNT